MSSFYGNGGAAAGGDSGGDTKFGTVLLRQNAESSENYTIELEGLTTLDDLAPGTPFNWEGALLTVRLEATNPETGEQISLGVAKNIMATHIIEYYPSRGYVEYITFIRPSIDQDANSEMVLKMESVGFIRTYADGIWSDWQELYENNI